MRGIPEFNFPAFDAHASHLRGSGHEVFNPAEEDRARGFDPSTDAAQDTSFYMAIDLPEVCKADAVAVLDGWEKSKGCAVELAVARMLGKPILSAYTLQPLNMKNIDFTVKDSGKRTSFESGMVRDITDDKVDYTLALDGPMFKRLAVHLTKGAKKYSKRNWMKAAGTAELERFKESAARHFFQWMAGDTDEDHAAACYFNIGGYEYVKERLNNPDKVA